MDETDRKILLATQDGLPLVPEPFAAVARQLGLSEEAVLSRLAGMLERGEVRRLGASLAHRRVGFEANVMAVWRVPGDAVETFGRAAASFPEVSHCYERPASLEWPYNVYAMVHGRTVGECQRVIDQICQRTGQNDYVALLSTREFKKTWSRIGP